jgi:hypothetical protein
MDGDLLPVFDSRSLGSFHPSISFDIFLLAYCWYHQAQSTEESTEEWVTVYFLQYCKTDHIPLFVRQYLAGSP